MYLTGTSTDSATITVGPDFPAEPYTGETAELSPLRSSAALYRRRCGGRILADMGTFPGPASRPQCIANFIAEHPGCSQKEIANTTGFSRGSILYNRDLLEQKKIVRAAAYFRSIRYIPAHSNGGSAMERTLRTVLTRRRPAQILFAGSQRRPGSERKNWQTGSELLGQHSPGISVDLQSWASPSKATAAGCLHPKPRCVGRTEPDQDASSG